MARRSKIPIKKEEERDLVLTKVQPSHPTDRHARDESRLTKIQPSHPKDKLSRKTKLNKIKKLNFYLKLDMQT